MISSRCLEEAKEYLDTFCNVKPNRRTGSQGNRDATIYFAFQINNK